MNVVFVIGNLISRSCETKRDVQAAFIDLEKVPTVTVSSTNVRENKESLESSVGFTEEFYVRVGLHQVLDRSPFLFDMITNVMTHDIENSSPWNVMFEDHSSKRLDKKLEKR